MSESILEELLAENNMLREKLNNKDVELSSKFSILSTKPLKIHGVLIAEGVWKGVLYDYNEMKKALNKFKNVPLKVQHGHTEEFGDRVVGRITKVEPNDLLKALTFEAEVTDPEAVDLVTKGTLDAVSIRGSFELIDSKETPPKGVNYTPEEVSLTPSPACDFCQIFNYELCREKLLRGEDQPTCEGDVKMSLNEEEIIIGLDDVLVYPDLGEDEEEGEFIIMKENEFKEELAKKKKKAVKVSPGKYPVAVKKVIKIGGKAVPKYPYYGYYPYYYYYYYPTLSEEEIVDMLLEGDYREFMKACMKEGKDMATCAKEWKEKNKGEEKEEKEGEEEMEEYSELELAEIKCPVCGEVFKTKKEFLEHWKEKHEDKYGEYGKVRKLMRDLKKKPELQRALKKHFELSEETKEEVKEGEKVDENVEKGEEKVEEKETGEEKEETPKETEEEKKETVQPEPKPEPKVEVEPSEPVKSEEEIVKEFSTPEKAAELLIRSVKRD